MRSNVGGWTRSHQELDLLRRNVASLRSTSPNTDQYQIVISYRSKAICKKQPNGGDGWVVLELRDTLQQLGYSVLLLGTEQDNNVGPEGSRWSIDVVKAIVSCEVVIVVCSPGYGETKWTLRELDLADRCHRKIVPLWLSGSYPPPAVEAYLGSLPRVPKGPLSLISRLEAAALGQWGQPQGFLQGQGQGQGTGRAKGQRAAAQAATMVAPVRRPDHMVLAAVVEELVVQLRRQDCSPRVARPAGTPYLPAVQKQRAAGRMLQGCSPSSSVSSSSSWPSVVVGKPLPRTQVNHQRPEQSREGVGASSAAEDEMTSRSVATAEPATAAAAVAVVDESGVRACAADVSPAPPAAAAAATAAAEGPSGSAPAALAAAAIDAGNDSGSWGASSGGNGAGVSGQSPMGRWADVRDNGGVTVGGSAWTSQQDALMKACLAFDIVRIRQLLDSGVSANLADESGWTALHRAAYRGNLVLVEVLLRAGADAGARTRLGDTPLHMASRQNNPLIVRVLLEAGADVNNKGQEGATPLHVASSWGRCEVVEELITAGADKEAEDEEGETAYHKAARAGEMAVARLLAQAGANKQALNKVGLTPLNYMAKCFASYPASAPFAGRHDVTNTGGSTRPLRASASGAPFSHSSRGKGQHVQAHENGHADKEQALDGSLCRDRSRIIGGGGGDGSGNSTLRHSDEAECSGVHNAKWWEYSAYYGQDFGGGAVGDGFTSAPFGRLWAPGGRSTLGRGSPGRVHDGRNRRASTGVLPALPLLLVPHQGSSSPPRHRAAPPPEQSPPRSTAACRRAAAALPAATRNQAAVVSGAATRASPGGGGGGGGGGNSGRQSLPAISGKSHDARTRTPALTSPLQAPRSPPLLSPLALPSPAATSPPRPILNPAPTATHSAIALESGGGDVERSTSPACRPVSPPPPPAASASAESQPVHGGEREEEGDAPSDPEKGGDLPSPTATIAAAITGGDADRQEGPTSAEQAAETLVAEEAEEEGLQQAPQDGAEGEAEAEEEDAGCTKGPENENEIENEEAKEEVEGDVTDPQVGVSAPSSTSSSVREPEQRDTAHRLKEAEEKEREAAQTAADSITRQESWPAPPLPPLEPEEGDEATATEEEAKGAASFDSFRERSPEDTPTTPVPSTPLPPAPPRPLQQQPEREQQQQQHQELQPDAVTEESANPSAIAMGTNTTDAQTDSAASITDTQPTVPSPPVAIQSSPPGPLPLPVHKDDEVIRLGDVPPALPPAGTLSAAAVPLASAATMREGEDGEWYSEPESEEEVDPETDYVLKPHPTIPPPTGPLLLIILSGIAEAAGAAGAADPANRHNAICAADTPALDAARSTAAAVGRLRTLRSHGTAVGLPAAGAVAHSEASHLTLACGRALPQATSLVDAALASGAIFRSPGWRHLRHAFSAPHTVHFIGLLSDGGVHSNVRHLTALLRGAVSSGAKRLRVHVLLDGRDVPDGSSVTYIDDLEGELAALRAGGCDARVASGGGRMRVTMDRYQSDWAVVKRGWDAHVLGQAPHTFTDPLTAIVKLRGSEAAPVPDQFLEPFVIVDEDDSDDYLEDDINYEDEDEDGGDEDKEERKQRSSSSNSLHNGRCSSNRRSGNGRGGLPVGPVQDGDGVVLFNSRAERMVQFAAALEALEGQFEGFERGRVPKDLRIVGLTRYDQATRVPAHVLVRPPRGRCQHVVGRYLVASGIPNLAVVEAASSGHITFCWNGNRSSKLHDSLDQHLVIQSDKCDPGRLAGPRAAQVAAAVREALQGGQHRFIRVFLPDPDLAAHTGDMSGTVRAIEAVDAAVGEMLATVDSVNGRWMLTSDHGNADDMVQRDMWGCPLYDDDMRPLPYPGHTNAPVPLLMGGAGLPDRVRFRKDMMEAGLANVAATLLNLLGFDAPDLYEPSLVAV